MKTRNLLALAAVLALAVVSRSEAAGEKLQESFAGKPMVTITGGGYLQNGYKCGMGIVQKQSGEVEGTFHCVSVTAAGKMDKSPVKKAVECDPVRAMAHCGLTDTATIICSDKKEITIFAGDPGDPTQNGAIAIKGWKGLDFPETPIVHGVVKIDCAP